MAITKVIALRASAKGVNEAHLVWQMEKADGALS